MKIILQEQLAKVRRPAITSTAFADLVTYYTRPGTAHHSAITTHLSNMPDTPAAMLRRWETKCYLLGLVFRMHADGHDPFRKLGMTGTEMGQCLAAFNLITSKIEAPATETSLTQQLYVKISNVDF